MATTLGMKQFSNLEKYMGVYVDGKNHMKRNASELLERFQNRLQGWKASLLSQAGRCTLIKSILQADPIYKMSVFQLPKVEVEKMESKMTDFFGDSKRKARTCI